MEDGRGSSGIGPGKSIGLAEGILLPAEAVESNRSRPRSPSGHYLGAVLDRSWHSGLVGGDLGVVK